MSVETAVTTLAKTLYGEDPCVVFKAIRSVFSDAKVYLAVCHGRAHMSGSAEQFCRVCGSAITGDLYEPLEVRNDG